MTHEASGRRPGPGLEAGGLRSGAAALGSLAMLGCLLAWPYIQLGVAIPLGGWQVDLPLADLAACALLPVAAWRLWRRDWPAGAAGFAGLVAVGLVSALAAADRGPALHELARRPVFFGVAYGLGLAGFVAWTSGLPWVRRALTAAVALAAAVSLLTSVGRIAAGDALWFSAITGLTNNHKTLAVALAPALALVWGWEAPEGERRVQRGVVLLGAVALLASASRTSWISAVVAAAFFVDVGGRALAERKGLIPALALAGLLAGSYAPVVTRSVTQIDALRSRHSIDVRSWNLFLQAPLVGASPGQSVRTELVKWPDYRVNGVDAHGVVQKVGAEYGLLGLAAFGAWVWALGRRVAARHRPGDGVWPAFVALHVNLVLSTETFTQTHWAILALTMGLTERREREPPA